MHHQTVQRYVERALAYGPLAALDDWPPEAAKATRLGMAESKSTWFALFIKAHSEEMRKFDLNPIKRLADISECRDARRALSR